MAVSRSKIISGRAAELFRAAFAEAMGGSPAAITESDGFAVSAQAVLTGRQLDVIASSRRLRREFDRVMDRVAKRTVERLRYASIPFRTGTFRSSWDAYTVEDNAPRTLRTRIVVVNPTPYAGYVHRKGTPRSATVVKLAMPRVLAQARQDLIAGLRGPEFAASVDAAVRSAVVESLVGRQGGRRGGLSAALGFAGLAAGAGLLGAAGSISGSFADVRRQRAEDRRNGRR